MQMETEQQELFSDLLARNTEAQLNQLETQQLEQLMQVFRRGECSQSKSLKISGRTWLEIIFILTNGRPYIPVEVVSRVRSTARNRCGYLLTCTSF